MQSDLDSPWFHEDDPETITLTVHIEGRATHEHDLPVSFLRQEFESDESRREFVYDQLKTMSMMASIDWRDNL